MTRTNILLLMCDQYRYDAFSFKGHPDVKTPYLDSLAAQGASFDCAYSACPSCIPARAALFSGKSQEHHGRVGYEDGIPWNYDHMLAQELSDHGYQTQCVGKMHVDPVRLSCGFQGLKLHDGYLSHYRSANIPYHQHQNITDDYLYYLHNQKGLQADVNAGGVECNSWITHPWIYEERLHPTNWAVDESIRFLETRDRTKPFFLMTSFVRPHQPFDAPQSYFDLYRGNIKQAPAQGDWDDTKKTEQYGMIKDSIYGCLDETMKKDAMAGYYASITHIDHQIGRLLSALENDGSYDDTLIIFLSDHGEMLFDHSLYRKALAYEGSSHIPLLFHVGKNLGSTKRMRSDSLTELRDILPTILDFADIAVPEGVDGYSLKDELLDNKTKQRSYLHGEHSFHSQLSSQFIVTNHDKYIWYSETGIEQYFDLVNDPKETHNAIQDSQYQQRIHQLRNALIQELKDREEGYSDGEKLMVGCKPITMLKKIK